MSKLKKLVQKFLLYPSEVRFDDLKYLLKAFGFLEVRSLGSHHIFRNEERRNIVIPKKGGKMVKGV